MLPDASASGSQIGHTDGILGNVPALPLVPVVGRNSSEEENDWVAEDRLSIQGAHVFIGLCLHPCDVDVRVLIAYITDAVCGATLSLTRELQRS